MMDVGWLVPEPETDDEARARRLVGKLNAATGAEMGSLLLLPGPKAVCPVCSATLMDARIEEDQTPVVEPGSGADAIVAWRAWDVLEVTMAGEPVRDVMLSRFIPEEPPLVTELQVFSPKGIRYPPERFEAKCWDRARPPHIAPDPNCSCGVYALKSKENFAPTSSGVPRIDFRGRALVHIENVLGEVYLWGRVIEAGGGYRAQYAYPKKLYLPGEAPKGVADSLRRTYRVPVEMG